MIYEQGDRRVASNILHKVLSGQHPNHQGFRFDALISESLIENVLDKYWAKFLSWTTWLGNITSTFIGIYMIARILKFVIDTIMHGRILYDIYGFGWQLLASFWDSLTTFLSHRSAMRSSRQQTSETVESNPINSVPFIESENVIDARELRQPPAQFYPKLTLQDERV